MSQDYVNQALKTHESTELKGPASSFLEYSTVTRDQSNKIPKLPRQKVYSSESEDYNYYFPESKRITTKTTVKPTTAKDFSEKYYKPQSAGAVITKDLKTNGNENVNTYHYYYPEEPTFDEKSHQYFPSSTFAPTTTKLPRTKFSAKKKTPTVQFEQTSTDSYQYQPVLQRPNEYLSNDQDFYPSYDSKNYAIHSTPTPSVTTPVRMLRPTKKNNYYLPSSTMSPSTTAKPMKIRRPSTETPYEDMKQFSVSPSPSTMAHYSTTRSPEIYKYSTTRAPEIYKYSTPSPVSSTTLGDFYIKPSTQVTPTAAVDLHHDGSERTVVIRPKTSYQSYESYDNYEPGKETKSRKTYENFKPKENVNKVNFDRFDSKAMVKDTSYPVYETVKEKNKFKIYEDFEPKATVKKTNFFNNFESQKTGEKVDYDSFEPKEKETIIYKFVPEDTYNYGSKVTYNTPKETYNYVSKESYDAPKETFKFSPNTTFHSTAASFPESIQSPQIYKNLNETTHADMEFYNDFQKNYNYEYFTEQDAGRMAGDENDDTQKMDQHHINDHFDGTDDKQRATKKNMFYEMSPQLSEEYLQSSMMSMPMNLDDHEKPPSMMHEITGDRDNDAEASKNQYFVLYSVDDEEKGKKHPKKPKRKQKQEPEVVYHHHHHEHDEKPEEHHHFDQEFNSEFDSELTNSDNVRIVDPNVRGGRPIEFTKDDYLRHIKQAVVQYMKDYPSPSNNNGKSKNQRYQESEVPYRPTKTPGAATTASSHKQNLPPQQYKSMSQLKLPKNVYTAERLSEGLSELHESPQIDLTIKKNKQKPFDLSAIDVGQSYQHVSHFDHSAALKNVDEFDQTDVTSQAKPKLHFSQQTYHDINNLGYNQKQKNQQQFEDSENEQLYKGYSLSNKYTLKGNGNQGGNSFSSMNYDGSKLPRIVSQRGQDDDDEDENKVEDPVDAPIQIINGIPVANPYNIDLNTLK